MEQWDVVEHQDKTLRFQTSKTGSTVIQTPLLNKGTAFTKKERDTLNLQGLLPPQILSLNQQIKKIYQRYQRLGIPLQICRSCKQTNKEKYQILKQEIDVARYNFLRDLQDRNEILFYAFSQEFLTEMVPIIYTPTVGEAVQRYSRDSARFQGIFLSPHNIQAAESILDQYRFKKPTITVVTDNQGILGLGDQGVGGIDIPIGKLALYVLGAGIRPWETLPLTLDVGTDNPAKIKDPYYLGYKAGRLTHTDYEKFLDQFVMAMKKKFPQILIQWEDFSKQNAFAILDRYRKEVTSFNDDIQGTGAMALAGTLNACKLAQTDLKSQRFLVYGAGAGGIGIARQIATCLQTRYKMTPKQARCIIAIMDSQGLVTDTRDKPVEDYKKPFLTTRNQYSNWNIEDSSHISLIEVIKNFGVTALYGTSGCPGHFTPEVLTAMTENTDHPIIFPLSNPGSKAEAMPHQIYRVTHGQGIVATGSPFPPFTYAGKKRIIGQGNNFFIFPGVGLGAIISQADYISDEVFTQSAYSLADCTPDSLVSQGTIFPSLTTIRKISEQIAWVTANQIAHEQKSPQYSISDIRSRMWKPQYHPIARTP